MPVFSFSPVNKPSKSKTNTSSSTKYETITPDVTGVVFMNLQGKYKVNVDKTLYNIAIEDYSCKGVVEIYEQTLVDNLTRVRHIRSERDRDDRDKTMYLPFTAGCCVNGRIVKHRTTGEIFVKIKKVFLDADNELARDAIKFYRDNYVVIRIALASDWIDNFVPTDEQHVAEDIVQVADVPEIDFTEKVKFSFNIKANVNR